MIAGRTIMRKTTLWIIGAFAASAAIFLLSPGPGLLSGDASGWVWREQVVLFSGVVALVFMTVAMVTSVRPAWLDRATGGLDKAYGLHKWAGICVAIAALLHWLGEEGPKWLVQLGWLAHPGHLGGDAVPPEWMERLVDTGALVGEWTFYVLLALVVVALFQRIPYRWFRYVHKAFPLVYLAAVFHTFAVMFKTGWWTTPAAWLLAGIAAVGVAASLVALFGRIGAERKVKAIIRRIERHGNGIVDITLQVLGNGFVHQSGQFAFVSFAHDREPHPYTIASSGDDPYTLRFAIKRLGDFTGALPERVREGQTVEIEGPYGQFSFDVDGERQIWVAGGIGITPFLSRLEALANSGGSGQPIDLWYCTRDDEDGAFPLQLEALCERAGVTLHRVVAAKRQYLHANAIQARVKRLCRANVWFCGPQSFAESLRKGLGRYGFRASAFHYDRFGMR